MYPPNENAHNYKAVMDYMMFTLFISIKICG